jgi:hypothetical protein
MKLFPNVDLEGGGLIFSRAIMVLSKSDCKTSTDGINVPLLVSAVRDAHVEALQLVVWQGRRTCFKAKTN